jgi:Na+/proline symporter
MMAQQYLPTVLYIAFIGALVSAILSTVDSALLNAGALVSHNIVLPLMGSTDERHKVLCARVAVASFGVIAYLLARGADSVYDLVVESSAFGSAGIFTCCLMGLVQKRGGSMTALASMLVGMVSYGALAYMIEYDYAYLMSLVSAFVTFFVLMWFEQGEDQFADDTLAEVAA